MRFNSQIIMLEEALYQAKRRGISRRAVAKKSGVAYNTIGSWLRGETIPTAPLLRAVISACGYNMFYGLEDKKC
jgi:transcriptional regulator with XRE-family HTH domain